LRYGNPINQASVYGDYIWEALTLLGSSLCTVGYALGASIVWIGSQLRAWLWSVANRRMHGTTHRVVDKGWQAERLNLQPLANRPASPYVPQVSRRVARDACVSYGPIATP
jgi:hypothetical protein